jgi:hypothetical protein
MFGHGFNDIFELHRRTDGSAYCISYNNLQKLDDREPALMQYTGLKDKNGVEIYEGDVVKGIKGYGAGFSRKPGKEALFEVNWGTGIGWGGWNLHQISVLPFGYRAYPLLPETEVIGNIYENPELLQPTNSRKNSDE